MSPLILTQVGYELMAHNKSGLETPPTRGNFS